MKEQLLELLEYYKEKKTTWTVTLDTEKDDNEVIFYKAIDSEVKASKDNERVVEGWLSRIEVDRDGDILEPMGADLKNYKKVPIVLFGHNYGGMAVGKCIDIKAVEGKGIYWVIEFADTAEGNDLLKLYKGGYMKAFSVGFRPKPKGYEPIRDEKTDQIIGYHYTKWEVLEGSCVTVPANQNAVSKALEIVKSDKVKSLLNGDSVGIDVNKATIVETEDSVIEFLEEVIEEKDKEIEALKSIALTEERVKEIENKEGVLKEYRKEVKEIYKLLGIETTSDEIKDLRLVSERVKLITDTNKVLFSVSKSVSSKRALLLKEIQRYKAVLAGIPHIIKDNVDYLRGAK
jgi:HK97 family phage prohead protease